MLSKTMLYKLPILILLLLSAALHSSALDTNIGQQKNDMNRCIPSEESLDNFEPAIFPKTNNLLSQQGNSEEFFGQKILLQGVLLDTNCVPISNAKIYLWQMASNGKFPYKFLRNIAPTEMSEIGRDSFLGAGTAVTDNNGRFHFLTIVPTKSSYPYINFRVAHRQYSDFQTQYTLQDSWKNAFDETFSSIQDNQRFAKYKIFYVKLVAPYKNKTRKY